MSSLCLYLEGHPVTIHNTGYGCQFNIVCMFTSVKYGGDHRGPVLHFSLCYCTHTFLTGL